MKKTYIVNLIDETEITNLYGNKEIISENKQLILVANNIISVGDIIDFRLNGNCVGFFRKKDVHSFYEYEQYRPSILDNLLDEFLLSWEGIITSGIDSIKLIYQRGMTNDNRYILNCLLTDICEETKLNFNNHDGNLICSRCFKKYKQLDDYKEQSLVYYGCPICKQTNRFYASIDKVVCLLDDRSQLGHYVKDDILYVNWLIINQDFDFNSVLILNASDFDIERLVVNLSETGIVTKKIPLEVKCYISDNSRKILNRYFDFK